MNKRIAKPKLPDHLPSGSAPPPPPSLGKKNPLLDKKIPCWLLFSMRNGMTSLRAIAMTEERRDAYMTILQREEMNDMSWFEDRELNHLYGHIDMMESDKNRAKTRMARWRAGDFK